MAKSAPVAPSRRALLFDLALLLLANAVTAFFFLKRRHSLSQVLITYYIQTVLIAVFYYKRLIHINATHILRSHWHVSFMRKVQALTRKTAGDEFIFVLIIFVPLAFLFYLLAAELSEGATIGQQHISVQSIAIASGLFLLHHLISYLLDLKEYRAGAQDVLRVPYKKLAVRVLTVVVVIYIGLTAFQPGEENQIFLVFIALKTVVDILLSSSFYWLQRSR